MGGNWKCNPEKLESAQQLCAAFKEGLSDETLGKVEVALFPSALHVSLARTQVKDGIAIGSQNVSVERSCGAFTGEVNASMAREAGCSWVLVGHSERRHKVAQEPIEDTVAKVESAQEAGLGVVLCVGELLEEREAGRTIEVCHGQLAPVLPKVKDWSKFVIAYEPVWAIGTGVVATKDQAQEAHQALREFVKETAGADAAEAVRIQYGGSVTAANSAGLISQPDIDGFLVGGESLKPGFIKIVNNVAAECE